MAWWDEVGGAVGQVAGGIGSAIGNIGGDQGEIVIPNNPPRFWV